MFETILATSLSTSWTQPSSVAEPVISHMVMIDARQGLLWDESFDASELDADAYARSVFQLQIKALSEDDE